MDAVVGAAMKAQDAPVSAFWGMVLHLMWDVAVSGCSDHEEVDDQVSMGTTD
jgi:hypothetical protein